MPPTHQNNTLLKHGVVVPLQLCRLNIILQKEPKAQYNRVLAYLRPLANFTSCVYRTITKAAKVIAIGYKA